MQTPVLDNLLQQNIAGLPVKDFLEQVTKEHPYFAPAHFFLLQLLNETNADFEKQAATTSLLFNNPHWLNFQLQKLGATAGKEAPVVAMYASKETEHILEPAIEPAASNTELPEPLQVKEPFTYTEEEVSVADNNLQEVTNISAPEIKMETVTEQPAELMPENTDNDDDNAVLIAEEVLSTEPPALKIDLGASIKSAENENAPAFEPMHMVDYFASQGIKLSEEVQTADKLGRQLKSFTEWLKTMKKVHSAETAVSGNEVAVQAMAEKSNAENEVVTEAMAAVFAQQGKQGKAIEVYEKLSLLNPGKSTFFASQIEKLKEQ